MNTDIMNESQAPLVYVRNSAQSEINREEYKKYFSLLVFLLYKISSTVYGSIIVSIPANILVLWYPKVSSSLLLLILLNVI
jgi:hypothetical protein